MLDTKSELGVASRAAALCSVFPGGAERRVLIADPQVGRGAALRAGWNDAAWGQPRREVEAAVVPSYERGYAGGLVFRQNREQDTLPQVVVDPLPQVIPAA